MILNQNELKQSLLKAINKKNVNFDFSKTNDIDFDRKIKIICDRVNTRSFYFHKVNKLIVPKSRGGSRIVFSMTMEDYIVQDSCLKKFYLENETFFNESVYGFLPKKSASQILKKIFPKLKTNEYNSMLYIDLINFTNNMNLRILKKIIDENINDLEFKVLLKRFISHQRLNEEYFEKEKGVYAGGPFSAFIMNLYLINFDKYVNENISGEYFRYGDDIIVFSNNNTIALNNYELINSYLKNELLLEVHQLEPFGKSKIYNLEKESFYFYYYRFNSKEIKLREPILERMISKVNEIIDSSNSLDNAIKAINYYFIKDCEKNKTQKDCLLYNFLICTTSKQLAYLNVKIRKKLFLKYKNTLKTNKALINLIDLKKKYYILKRKNLEKV